MNLTDVLTSIVEGVYGETATDRLPEAFMMAPRYASLTGKAEFLLNSADGRWDERKSFGKAVSASAKFEDDPYQLSTVTVPLATHNTSQIVIPEVVAASMNVDVTSDAMNRLAEQIYAAYISEFLNVAGNDLPNAGSSFNISSPSAAAVSTIHGYIDDIVLASGHEPNRVWMSRKAANKFLLLDEVQNGTAITGFTTSGSSVRRTGSANLEQLRNWFDSQFGLELIVESRTYTNTSGTSAYLGEDKMIIAKCQDGSLDSALKTFHLGTYGGPNLLKYSVKEAHAPYPDGMILRASATYAVAATNPNAGLFIDLTL